MAQLDASALLDLAKAEAAAPRAVERRRSDRVQLRLPLKITGAGPGHHQWQENARTDVVTLHGASLVLKRTLRPGDTVVVSFHDKRQSARIIGQVGIGPDGHIYGISFVSDAKGFWGIAFPDPAGSAIGKILAHCGNCFHQEVLNLNEIELMVYESNQHISRWCSSCSKETLWRQAEALQDQELISNRVSIAEAMNQYRPKARKVNERKHPRLAVRSMLACIQVPDRPADVVKVLDVSRGGMRFLSEVDYVVGTWVQVAVPYTEAAANVFIAARVVRVKSRPAGGIPGEFALMYAI